MTTKNQTFVGIDEMKELHKTQLEKFETAAEKQDWNQIHDTHYDWWMFPINEISKFDWKYSVNKEDIEQLRLDSDYMQEYRRGVKLLLLSWGWDINSRKLIEDPNVNRGQKWANWPVRLYKAGRSLQLFGEDELFQSVKDFTLSLKKRDVSLVFRDRHVLDEWENKPLWNDETNRPIA